MSFNKHTSLFGNLSNFDINDLQAKIKYKGTQQYSRSKLMNVLFTYKLVREHLKETNTNMLRLLLISLKKLNPKWE